MRRFQLLAVAMVLALATAAQAGPPVRIGIGIGFGGPYYYRPYGWYPYYYGYPYPYAAPPPVYYQAPVVVQPGTVVGVTPSYSSPPTSTNEPLPAPTAVPNLAPIVPANAAVQNNNLDLNLGRLSSPDEMIRHDAVMDLGRAKNERACDPLAATMAGDKSASVRDAAARALGLIASPRSLTALIHAAQADPDRDVRHSAQFAVEIIRSNLRN